MMRISSLFRLRQISQHCFDPSACKQIRKRKIFSFFFPHLHNKSSKKSYSVISYHNLFCISTAHIYILHFILPIFFFFPLPLISIYDRIIELFKPFDIRRSIEVVITSSTRNRVGGKTSRGFESHLLRQRKDSIVLAIGSFFFPFLFPFYLYARFNVPEVAFVN